MLAVVSRNVLDLEKISRKRACRKNSRNRREKISRFQGNVMCLVDCLVAVTSASPKAVAIATRLS